METSYKRFFYNNNISVLDVNSRKYPVYPSKYEFNSTISDKSDLIVRTENLYVIQIPESNLKMLDEMERFVINNRSSPGYYDLFQNVLHDNFEERELRNKNAAVSNAYDNYVTLLTLAGFTKRVK